MRRILRLFPVVVALSAAVDARAQSAADKAAARALADDADASLAAKNFGTAVEKYQKALLLVPDALTLRLGLARAQAGVGKFLEATESYNTIIRAPLGPSAPAPFRAAQKDAEREIVDTSSHIGAVLITLVVPGGKRPPPSPTLSIDDEAISAALVGERRPANPGRHTIRFKAEGFQPAEARVEVKEGQTSPVSINLVPAAPAPTPPPASAAAPSTAPPAALPPEQPPSTPPPNRTAAYVALGLGGAGVLVGGIAGAVAISKHGTLSDRCVDGCPPGSQGDIDSYRTAGSLSTVGFVVGGVGIATGSVLWLLTPSAPKSAQRRTITPFLTSSGMGAFGTF